MEECGKCGEKITGDCLLSGNVHYHHHCMKVATIKMISLMMTIMMITMMIMTMMMKMMMKTMMMT